MSESPKAFKRLRIQRALQYFKFFSSALALNWDSKKKFMKIQQIFVLFYVQNVKFYVKHAKYMNDRNNNQVVNLHVKVVAYLMSLFMWCVCAPKSKTALSSACRLNRDGNLIWRIVTAYALCELLATWK